MFIQGIKRFILATAIWVCSFCVFGWDQSAEVPGAADRSGITVLMSIDAAGNLFDQHIDGFTTQHNIAVESVVAPWDGMMQKQTVALASGRATDDIVDCGSFMLPRYVPNGRYSDISNVFDSDDRNQFMAGLLEAVTVKGKIYAAPLMASWTIFFYNKLRFLEARLNPNSPPQTWSELLTTARAMKKKYPDIHPYTDSFGAGEIATCAFFRWAKSAGAKIHEMNGGKAHWSLDSPRMCGCGGISIETEDRRLT